MKREKTKVKNTNKGITLIALVITIIVLLILAGVSIAMLTGENGVLTKATEAKDQTEIAQEKEEISMSYAAAKANKVDKVSEDVTADELNAELEKLNSKGRASGSGTLTVTFSDSQRKYTIDQTTGKISEITGDNSENIEESTDYLLAANIDEGELSDLAIGLNYDAIKQKYLELLISSISKEDVWTKVAIKEEFIAENGTYEDILKNMYDFTYVECNTVEEYIDLLTTDEETWVNIGKKTGEIGENGTFTDILNIFEPIGINTVEELGDFVLENMGITEENYETAYEEEKKGIMDNQDFAIYSPDGEKMGEYR